MRCDICDKEDDLISFDKSTGKFCPCGTCQAVIDETIREFEEIDAEDNA